MALAAEPGVWRSVGLSQKSWGGWRLCGGAVGPAHEGSKELVQVYFR